MRSIRSRFLTLLVLLIAAGGLVEIHAHGTSCPICDENTAVLLQPEDEPAQHCWKCTRANAPGLPFDCVGHTALDTCTAEHAPHELPVGGQAFTPLSSRGPPDSL